MKKRQIINIMKAFVLAAASWGELAFASIVNGDFSAGFTGWQGEVIDISTNTATTVTPLPSPIYLLNFQNLNPNGAVLQTSSTDAAPNDIWSVSLSQQFDLDTPLNPGDKLLLNVDISSNRSDLFSDYTFAQMEDLSSGPLAPIDLSTGGLFDLSTWAGRSVILSFGVQDGDDIADSLVIRRISLEVVPISNVPEPSSAVLMLSSLVLISRRRFNTGA